MDDTITIRGARLHNLKNITLRIPKNTLVVLTGLSGSGKSTLAFDTLHKEGQRQYLESLGLVTDHLSKPKVDRITGLSPSISVDQHVTNRNPRSTVGTATEVFTYLRVLFARLGHRQCPQCGHDIPPSHQVNGVDMLEDEPGDQELTDNPDAAATYPCPHCGARVPELGMAHFSFNKIAGACPTCTGLGSVTAANLAKLIDPGKSILAGGVTRWTHPDEIARYSQTLKNAGQYYGFAFDPALPIQDYTPIQSDLLIYGVNHARFRRHFSDKAPAETSAQGRFEGIETNLLRRYGERADDADYREKLAQFLIQATCPDCQGERLRLESRQVTVAGRTIIEVAHLPLTELAAWLTRLAQEVAADEASITEPILIDLRERVQRLLAVGVGYLSLERGSPTLSGGEAQRLRLAALLGSGLTGVLYVLDEPTIGLHPRDTQMLIQVFRQLRDLGNTVVVIEHDPDVMRAADYLIDVGPGAGREGGEIVVAGTPDAVAACPQSLTGGYLAGRLAIPIPAQRRRPNGKALVIRGAREHSLRDVTVTLPLGLLIAVTGVSGSGKSSLMLDILDRAARQRFYGARDIPGQHAGIDGWEYVDKIVTIDQTAIGRTPRSNAATYTDAFTAIRQVFADLPAAQTHNLRAGHFSFNVVGGRCEQCQGAGELTVNMHFLPDVQVRCPACQGRRFKRDVLTVTYHGKHIADILNMTITEAHTHFQDVPAVAEKLKLMLDVGLGYLQLGQPATTLSGGEAQRIKLAKELSRRTAGRTIYLLDEPTTGLHPHDTARLLTVLHRLADAGNTVLVIEHNLDVIKVADWVLDLGPEGGVAGGQVVVAGTPEQVAQVAASYTGQFLRPVLTAQLRASARL